MRSTPTAPSLAFVPRVVDGTQRSPPRWRMAQRSSPAPPTPHVSEAARYSWKARRLDGPVHQVIEVCLGNQLPRVEVRPDVERGAHAAGAQLRKRHERGSFVERDEDGARQVRSGERDRNVFADVLRRAVAFPSNVTKQICGRRRRRQSPMNCYRWGDRAA